VGLIAGALEEAGIRTVCLSTLDAIMGQVRPPRWLDVPFPLGYPLGRPGEAALQAQILRQAFRLLEEEGPGPVRREFDPENE
jgi:hypothetical protein